MILHVDVKGNNEHSGLNAKEALATIQGAYDKLARLHVRGMLDSPSKIIVHGGDYHISAPLHFYRDFPVEIAPNGKDKVFISGGEVITGWKKTKVNGKICFRTALPESVTDLPFFYVNGKSADPARWPKKDWFHVGKPVKGLFTNEETCDSFFVKKGDFDPKWYDPQNITVKMIHYWVEETLKVESYDAKEGKITTASAMNMVPDDITDYALFNVREVLSEPNEYYFDRLKHEVLYIPEDPSKPFEAVVPQCATMVRMDSGARWVTLRGLTFRFGGKYMPVFCDGLDLEEPGYPKRPTLSGNGEFRKIKNKEKYQGVQASAQVPGVLFFDHACDCTVADCEICACAWYGVDVYEACERLNFTGNHIHDMGAGGIILRGPDFEHAQKDHTREISRITISRNHIHDCTKFYYSAVGIVTQHAWGCLLEENHIHDLNYSGISCGWVWGYAPSLTHDMRIHKNHIHDLGKGLLSDMGGIYTLGVQPGTRIWENVIHGIVNHSYGGWGLYMDEGSSHIILEKNIVYDCAWQAFHQHYGRENIIRWNIFAFNKIAGIAVTHNLLNGYCVPGDMHSLCVTFLNNVFITDHTSPVRLNTDTLYNEKRIYSDNNIFYDVSGKKDLPMATIGEHADPKRVPEVTLKEWQDHGLDRHSVFCDPGFRNVRKKDFRLKKDSILRNFGFED